MPTDGRVGVFCPARISIIAVGFVKQETDLLWTLAANALRVFRNAEKLLRLASMCCLRA